MTAAGSLPRPALRTVATHWGLYRAQPDPVAGYTLRGWEGDVAPAAMGADLIAARTHPCRIRQPCVRRSWLLGRGIAPGGRRGAEPFVAVDWDTALDLVAEAIARVRSRHGNGAIFGGSYGWSSAGRFHHAQSQVHRFLNAAGGAVRSMQNYSFAAGDVILPHVIGSTTGLAAGQTPWRLIAGHAELLVLFGGAPVRNGQVNAGGIAHHGLPGALEECRARGIGFVNVSPIRDDMSQDLGAEWLALRPGTDTALMLGIAHTLIAEELHDTAFLDRATVGFDVLRAYITGAADGTAKDPAWAAAITGIPAADIAALARRMAGVPTFIMMGWSLQRARHGEQPFWMAIALAAMLGGIGLPGQGVGFGYASAGGVGAVPNAFPWPALPQGVNPVTEFIPVARIADMLLQPGAGYDYNGQRRTYPDIRMIYWAGGNPFHHHQDINRLVHAWQVPETVVVHDSFWNAHARHADIVLPATVMLERNDIACSARGRFIAASHKLFEPAEQARDDYAIFCALASRLGVLEAFSAGRTETEWLRTLYAEAVRSAGRHGQCLPPFERFWQDGVAELPEPAEPVPMLAAYRADPAGHPLRTPSGRIELASATIAGFGYADCPGHPAWLPPEEWLGSATPEAPLHLLSNQPAMRLHSQFDHAPSSQQPRPAGREVIRMCPQDATSRGLASGDMVRVTSSRGGVLAAVVISAALRPGVVQMPTGAWYDPSDPSTPGSLDKHGNPNVLTMDVGTSALAQGPSANSCLVQVARHDGPLPPLTCYEPPEILT